MLPPPPTPLRRAGRERGRRARRAQPARLLPPPPGSSRIKPAGSAGAERREPRPEQHRGEWSRPRAAPAPLCPRHLRTKRPRRCPRGKDGAGQGRSEPPRGRKPGLGPPRWDPPEGPRVPPWGTGRPPRLLPGPPERLGGGRARPRCAPKCCLHGTRWQLRSPRTQSPVCALPGSLWGGAGGPQVAQQIPRSCERPGSHQAARCWLWGSFTCWWLWEGVCGLPAQLLQPGVGGWRSSVRSE